MGKHITLPQFQAVITDLTNKSDARFLKQADVFTYEIRKQTTAETGFASTYQEFKVSGDGETAVPVGAKINIPKDIFVQSVSTVQTVTVADQPEAGFAVGDKYVSFTVSTIDSESPTVLNLNLKDLTDTYTADGNAIKIDANNQFYLQIDSSNANGLSQSASGLALSLATSVAPVGAGDPYTAGNSGAMSGADKAKLDNITEASQAEIEALIATIYADEEEEPGGGE